MSTPTPKDDGERVLGAMRSGEWLRTQWIARVAFGLGTRPWRPQHGQRALLALRRLESAGRVEQRPVTALREGEVAGLTIRLPIPRAEWRLRGRHEGYSEH
jgi:hypothetical protein